MKTKAYFMGANPQENGDQIVNLSVICNIKDVKEIIKAVNEDSSLEVHIDTK